MEDLNKLLREAVMEKGLRSTTVDKKTKNDSFLLRNMCTSPEEVFSK